MPSIRARGTPRPMASVTAEVVRCAVKTVCFDMATGGARTTPAVDLLVELP